MDPTSDEKDNVLIMTDTFSNFTVAVATPKQQTDSHQSPSRQMALHLWNAI